MTKPKAKTTSPTVQPATADAAPAPRRSRARAGNPQAEPMPPPASPSTKLETLVVLISRKQGATLEELMSATGWQAHSVRGALAGALRKRFGAKVISEKVEVGRVYRAPKP